MKRFRKNRDVEHEICVFPYWGPNVSQKECCSKCAFDSCSECAMSFCRKHLVRVDGHPHLVCERCKNEVHMESKER